MLATLQQRPLLVQPLQVGVGKAAKWVTLQEAPVASELWTRGVLLNEVIFDIDARPWSLAAEKTAAIVGALRELGIPHYAHLSGGKGTHTSVFIDAASVVLPAPLLTQAQAVGVDVWSAVRLAVAEAILDAAGFPKGDDARWTPPVGNGVVDRLKVKWSALRNGSMVRCLGTMGSYGFRKTWAPDDFDWKAAVAWETPQADGVQFHSLPQLLDVRDISDRIARGLDVAVRQRAAMSVAEHRSSCNPLHAIAQARKVPCVARILEEAAPRGTRHYAFLNLAVTCRTLGVPLVAAQKMLRHALELSGLDESDPAWTLLAEVYDGRYQKAASCPSPHVSGWCKPNDCPLSKRFEFC
jgi:hypothetical protein